MDQSRSKKAIRQEIIKRRAALDPLEREQNSFAAARRLLSWSKYQEAKTVLLFAGVRSEIDTRFLAQESLRLGKCVAMPRCVPKSRELLLLEIESWEDLKPGFYGLLEPGPEEPCILPTAVDLIVSPGVAFSPSGYRIGYGGGYYDRLIAQLPGVLTVGLAFELQVVASLPRDMYDMPVDFLVTEEDLVDCRAVREKKGDVN
jgi:5-formyltetrahydrofolate cyclo-ligase